MTPHTPLCCSGFRQMSIHRRTLLKIGGLGALSLGLPDLLHAEEAGASPPARKKNVILLFQFGGPSHQDTFDMKPNAPAEIRGEFDPIETNVPGIQIVEHLPRLAKIADRYALVRSVNHKSSAHNPGAYYSLTGREPLINRVTLNASATDFPHPGSIVDFLDRDDRPVPTSVSLPTMIADGPFRTPGEFAGFLGKRHDPLWVLRDPNAPDFSVDELTLPTEIDVDRLNDRRQTLSELDALSRLTDHVAGVKGMNEYQKRALELLSSPETKQAFAIDDEPDSVRDNYGRNTYGQSVLLSRRLVEAGVRFVTVYYSRGIGGWDTHANNFPTLKDSRLPHTDAAVSSLLLDLEERGLLDDTLVYWTGDFGRTPKINQNAGRDHWPQCQTLLMAGGGIRGGQVYGASDAHAAYPHENPLRPDDITATVFHALGLDPETLIHDQLDRPVPISEGRPVRALFG